MLFLGCILALDLGDFRPVVFALRACLCTFYKQLTVEISGKSPGIIENRILSCHFKLLQVYITYEADSNAAP